MRIHYRNFAITLAQDAGKILMRHYGHMQKIEHKSRTDFKTRVDDESDAFIRRKIIHTFPDHNIYSEEERTRNRNSDFSWVIDPLLTFRH